MKRPERPISSDWLDLRRPADERARAGSAPLLDALAEHFTETGADSPVDVIDVGAGTGANPAWLAPRLRFSQQWTLLDHDADLLELVPSQLQDARVRHVRRVTAGIEDLGSLDEAEQDRCLITCSAVLDLLTMDQLAGFCDFLAEPRMPALLSLSVTGDVVLDPGHWADAQITRAFNQHQRRGSLAGPDAVGYAAGRLRADGMRVEVAESPWKLGPADDVLLRRYLHDRAQAVIEGAPDMGDVVDSWLAEHLGQSDEGRLHVEVRHRELLCLPPG